MDKPVFVFKAAVLNFTKSLEIKVTLIHFGEKQTLALNWQMEPQYLSLSKRFPLDHRVILKEKYEKWMAMTKEWTNLICNSEWNLDLTDSEHPTLRATSFLLIVSEHELAVLDEVFYESICLTFWSI